MRKAIALLVATSSLGAASAAAGASVRIPRSALVPDAVAFRDRVPGVLGTGRQSCVGSAFQCRLQGTIPVTSDGGRH